MCIRDSSKGLLACEGKLSHLGLNKLPALCTLSDATRKRSFRVFAKIYQDLLKQKHPFISDSRLKGLSIRNLKVIDSTSIRLFSEILRGAGRKPLDGSRRKGGIKVHTMMDAFSGVTEFVRMTEARVHDRKFMYLWKSEPDSWLVFDKSCNAYGQFAKWTRNRVWFETRMKYDAVFHVTKVFVDNMRKKDANGRIEKGAALDFRQVIFRLKPNTDEGYGDFMKNSVGQ